MRRWLGAAALLLTSGCGGIEEPPYRPPVEVKVTLTPGQQVVCENSSARFGLPLASPPGAIIFWQRHRFVCHMAAA